MINDVYIIAEAGVNHNGRLDLALKMCEVAKNAGVDAVKFQTWQTEQIVTRTAAMAKYQLENIQKSESQFSMLKKLELSWEDFAKIKNYCDSIGITFLSTSDFSSLDFLFYKMDLPIVKIGSGDITNIPYLRKVGLLKKPVIMSTGMATLSQVGIAYDTLLASGAPKISLLHCTTNYPCPVEEVNLNAMNTLKEAFKCEVGYSDHTMGIEIPIASVAMGAKIIEKHFTLDSTMSGPDHKASIGSDDLGLMVKQIRNVEKALGNGIKSPNKSEQEISLVVLKRILARDRIKKREILTEDRLIVKRSGEGLSAANWDLVVGSTAIKDYDIDEPIIF